MSSITPTWFNARAKLSSMFRVADSVQVFATVFGACSRTVFLQAATRLTPVGHQYFVQQVQWARGSGYDLHNEAFLHDRTLSDSRCEASPHALTLGPAATRSTVLSHVSQLPCLSAGRLERYASASPCSDPPGHDCQGDVGSACRWKSLGVCCTINH